MYNKLKRHKIRDPKLFTAVKLSYFLFGNWIYLQFWVKVTLVIDHVMIQIGTYWYLSYEKRKFNVLVY